MKLRASLWLLAGTLLPAAAQAEPGVTLYGVISTAVRYTSNLDGRHDNRAELVSSGIGGSRWGLKGTEELGGGNRAVFLLENGFGTDDGRTAYNALFGRRAYAGLTGTWGSLTFGRQYNALNNIGWAFNPLDQSWGNFWSDPLYTGGDIFFGDYRINHSVVYKHTLGPVSVQLDYGRADSPAAGARQHLRWRADVPAGALSVGVAYDQRRVAGGGNTLHNYSAGASYVLGKATFYAGHMGRREAAGDARFGIGFVGVGYQLTWRSMYPVRTTTTGSAATSPRSSVPRRCGWAAAGPTASPRCSTTRCRSAPACSRRPTPRARGGAVGRETEYWGGQPLSGWTAPRGSA